MHTQHGETHIQQWVNANTVVGDARAAWGEAHTAVGICKHGSERCTCIRLARTIFIRCFWQGNHQIYGHIRCEFTVLANLIHAAWGDAHTGREPERAKCTNGESPVPHRFCLCCRQGDAHTQRGEHRKIQPPCPMDTVGNTMRA